MTVTGEIGKDNEARAAGFLEHALAKLGEIKFRDSVAELASEMETDQIRNPGAILTKKLKGWMEA